MVFAPTKLIVFITKKERQKATEICHPYWPEKIETVLHTMEYVSHNMG